MHLVQTSESGASVTVEFFGIGKAALDGLLASLLDLLALRCQPVAVDALLGVIPNVAHQHLSEVGALGALIPQRTVSTLPGF